MVLCFKFIYASDINAPDMSKVASLGTMSLSLSSDAHYAVSSNLANQIILWDLYKHTHKIIANNANVYSAYYIKHSPYFMWQSTSMAPIQMGVCHEPLAKEKLSLVSRNKLAVIAYADKHYYVYYYVTNNGNITNHINRKLIPTSVFNHYFLKSISTAYFNPGPYDPAFTIIKNLSIKAHFIQLLTGLGYHSNNIVTIQKPSGKIILQFDHFPVYSQIMDKNLKTYFSTSFNWDLYKGYGSQRQLMMYDNGGFLIGKVLNLSYNANKNILLTAGINEDYLPISTQTDGIKNNMQFDINHRFHQSKVEGVTLWNAKTTKPLHAFKGDVGMVYGILSPSGNYALTLDDNFRFFVWSTSTYKLLSKDWNLYEGKPLGKDKHGQMIFNTKGLIKPPVPISQGPLDEGYSLKFIDKTHFLRFAYGLHYAILYDIKDSKPIKYFNLGDNPSPAFGDYSQNQAIDSSPSKHILVIAMHSDDSGILEYKYDPKKMTLKRIWVGNFPAKEAEAHLNSYLKKHTPVSDLPKGPQLRHWQQLAHKMMA